MSSTWLRTSVLPGSHFSFELKNIYYVIINIINIYYVIEARKVVAEFNLGRMADGRSEKAKKQGTLSAWIKPKLMEF